MRRTVRTSSAVPSVITWQRKCSGRASVASGGCHHTYRAAISLRVASVPTHKTYPSTGPNANLFPQLSAEAVRLLLLSLCRLRRSDVAGTYASELLDTHGGKKLRHRIIGVLLFLGQGDLGHQVAIEVCGGLE